MRRREFIAGLGSAVAYLAAARAQERTLLLVGYLHIQTPEFAPVGLIPFR